MIGAKYERELQKKLNAFPKTFLQRVTGSATGEQGLGDLIGVVRGAMYLIEVKSTRKDRYYLSKDPEQFTLIKEALADLPITPVLAVRFKRPVGWKFVNLRERLPTKVTRQTESDFTWLT